MRRRSTSRTEYRHICLWPFTSVADMTFSTLRKFNRVPLTRAESGDRLRRLRPSKLAKKKTGQWMRHGHSRDTWRFRGENMIIVRAPLRVSFFGGGTDLPAWFNRPERAAVLSTTINKYVYVQLRRLPAVFDFNYRIAWGMLEEVKTVREIK